MYNVYCLTTFFKNNPDVAIEIKEYIEISFKRGQLKAVESNTSPLIFKLELFEETNGNVLIKNEYFNYILLLFLKEIFKYPEINNYEEYEIFIKKAKKEIEKLTPFSNTWSNFETFMYIYFNQTKGWDFKGYLLKYNNKEFSKSFLDFKSNFSKALPHLKIPEDSLTEILYYLFFQDNQVFKSVQEYCHNHSTYGWKLVEYMVQKDKTYFVVPALIGLSKINFNKTFKYVKQLFYKKDFCELAIFIFSVLEYENYEYLEDILKLLDNVESDDEHILAVLATFYGNLIHSPFIPIIEKIDYLFEKLCTLAKKDISLVQYKILFSVFRGEKDEFREKKAELLMHFTKADNKHNGIIGEIENALTTLKKPKTIFKFIEKWILNHQAENYKNIFAHALRVAYNTNLPEFIENYIFLIIHNKGKIRHFANSNTDFLKVTEDNKQIWKTYLCQLDYNQVIKFISSIFSDTFESEERMKLALIILQKKDKTVFKYILQSFEELVRDYGSVVEEVVTNFLDKNDPFEKQFINSFTIFYKKIVNFWDAKIKINEFDPFESQGVYISNFDKLLSQKHSEDLKKSIKKHSIFMKLCKKITISRGRKFKIGTNGQYAEMKEFKKYFNIPRTYFIFPELYDYKRQKSFTSDWEGNQ